MSVYTLYVKVNKPNLSTDEAALQNGLSRSCDADANCRNGKYRYNCAIYWGSPYQAVMFVKHCRSQLHRRPKILSHYPCWHCIIQGRSYCVYCTSGYIGRRFIWRNHGAKVPGSLHCWLVRIVTEKLGLACSWSGLSCVSLSIDCVLAGMRCYNYMFDLFEYIAKLIFFVSSDSMLTWTKQ